MRQIPRIFIYDCCNGNNDIVKDQCRRVTMIHGRRDTELSKGSISLERGDRGYSVREAYGSGKNIWYKGEANPDYNLVIINSSNRGFMSQMGSKSGSYMIRLFTEKLWNNIDKNKNKLFLSHRDGVLVRWSANLDKPSKN